VRVYKETSLTYPTHVFEEVIGTVCEEEVDIRIKGSDKLRQITRDVKKTYTLLSVDGRERVQKSFV